VSGLPHGWVEVTLQDVAIWSSGGTPSRANPAYYEGEIPWFKTGELGPRVLYSAEEHISQAAVDASSAKLFPKGSVALAMYGATIGKTSIFGIDAATNQACAVGKPDAVSVEFLYYFLVSQEKSFGEAGKGGAQPNISQGIVKSWPFLLPPSAEQTRILEKLEELLTDLDAGVAELKAAQKKLAQYRQSLLKAAVEGALTAEWRANNKPTETGAQLLERILQERRARWEAKQLAKFKEQGKAPPKDWQKKYPEPVQPDTTDLPELPNGWVWANVDQLSEVIRGASPRPAGDPRFFGGNIPWITVGSITCDDEIFLERTEQFVTEAGKHASRFIEVGTLLLTNSGATLGVPKISKISGCINDGSVALLDVDEVTKLYLYWFLKTQTERLRAMNQGAAQPNLNTDIVRRIHVPLCSLAEQQEIIQVVQATVAASKQQGEAVLRSLKQSNAQRQNILKAAFSGQLVPQDPTDEPANELLERICAERAAQQAVKKPRGRKAKEAV
jgi:type I restriction enzyme S subunit